MKRIMLAALVFVPATLLTGCATETTYYTSGYNTAYVYPGSPYYYGYNNVDYGLSIYDGGYYNGGWGGGAWRGGNSWRAGGWRGR